MGIFSFGFMNSQNLFQDNFNTYTNGLSLSGQGSWTNNSSLPGGAGTASNSGPGSSKIIDTGMSYLNYGTSTKSVDIKINADACGTPFPAVSSGDLFVSFLLNLSSVQANNNSDFFRVMSADNFNTSFRMYAIPSGSGFVLGIAKGANGNAISFTTTVLNLNTDHLIVFKYTQSSGTNDDVLSIYADPVYAAGTPIIASATTSVGNDQAGNLDRMNFRQNWTNGMPTGRIGLPSVSSTWQGLSFQPLSNQAFDRSEFQIISNLANSGTLIIKSNIYLGNSRLNIFDLQGKLIATKNVTLNIFENLVPINPIQNSGIYIVQIISENGTFSQKILFN